MKTLLFYSLLITIALNTISCQQSGSVDATTSQVVTSGNWRVSLFTDSGNDETADFAGYTFTFNSGGSLAVVKNGVTTTGSWSINSSSNKFNIDLGPKIASNKPLGELTDDWKILSNTTTEIRLADDNVTSNEFVTFSKN